MKNRIVKTHAIITKNNVTFLKDKCHNTSNTSMRLRMCVFVLEVLHTKHLITQK